jgi:hypothetical protein
VLDVGTVVEGGTEPGTMPTVPLVPANAWGPPVAHWLIDAEATDFYVAPFIVARVVEKRGAAATRTAKCGSRPARR